MNICGNFAGDGQCGTCGNYGLTGVCSGVCMAVNEFAKEVMSSDDCDCGKYEKGECQVMA